MGEHAVLLRSQHGVGRRWRAVASGRGAVLSRARLYAGPGRRRQVAHQTRSKREADMVHENMGLTRRSMLAAGVTTIAAMSARSAFAAWEPSEGYPDPAVEVLDPRFERYRLFNASVERL